MRGSPSHTSWSRRAAELVVICALLLSIAAPAFALTNEKVTLDAETGGQLTRFTFTALSDEDATISSMDFIFSEGFDTSESMIGVTLLEGLRRLPAEYEQQDAGDPAKARIVFATPVPAASQLFIEINDVMTPIQGGEYPFKVEYSAEVTGAIPATEMRSSKEMTFEFATPSRDEALSRWLDQQAWVEAWTSVKFLNIFFRPQQVVRAVPLLFYGWLLSLALVLTAFPISIVGGLATAFMKMSKIPPVRWIAAVYINVIRGTPLFLQIFVVFIGLRIAGFRVPDFISAVAVLSFNSSAYLAEIFRAGIQSISKGQFEAASSLGMSYWQAMRYVVIPQTVRRVLPTMTSEFILLFKDTALFAAVGIFELMLRSQNFVARSGNLSAYVIAAGYYLLITIPLINLVGRLEVRLAQSEHGVAAPSPKRRGGRDRSKLIDSDAPTASAEGGSR